MYICGVQLTIGIWLTIRFPSQNPGVRGGGGGGETMSVDIAKVPDRLRGKGVNGRWVALIFI